MSEINHKNWLNKFAPKPKPSPDFFSGLERYGLPYLSVSEDGNSVSVRQYESSEGEISVNAIKFDCMHLDWLIETLSAARFKMEEKVNKVKK